MGKKLPHDHQWKTGEKYMITLFGTLVIVSLVISQNSPSRLAYLMTSRGIGLIISNSLQSSLDILVHHRGLTYDDTGRPISASKLLVSSLPFLFSFLTVLPGIKRPLLRPVFPSSQNMPVPDDLRRNSFQLVDRFHIDLETILPAVGGVQSMQNAYDYMGQIESTR